MTVGELYGRATPGTDTVRCYLCGRETEVGWAGAPSSAFTDWSACLGGNGHCEYCRTLLKERPFRLYSWMMVPGELHIADKEHRAIIWDTLLDPPEGMWAIYQTVGGQKQAWLRMAQEVNQSRRMYRIAVDWLDRPIVMSTEAAQSMAGIIVPLRAAEVTKASLLSGEWHARDYARAVDAGLEREYRLAVEQARDPRWEVMVNAQTSSVRAV